MRRLFSCLLAPLRGSGDHAITLPPMDGALQPNEILERAPLAAALPAPDALVEAGDDVVVSCGAKLVAFADGDLTRPRPVAALEAPATCLAVSHEGLLAAGLATGSVVFLTRDGEGRFHRAARAPVTELNCPTALAWAPDGALLVCNGSARHGPFDWKRDLTERGASGALWRVAPDGEARSLASGLAFPNGILICDDGGVLVSESWRSRLLRIGAPGAPPTPALTDLPGYPAGLAARAGGGAWLAVFAPRSQLFEFVLREREFREQMMREIDPDYWIAPSLKPSRSFLEPLQGGALKQLGMMKPWAPTRSYGLVVGLDARWRPDVSAHSRADGARHGVRNVLERDGRLWVASQGGDALVVLDLSAFGDLA